MMKARLLLAIEWLISSYWFIPALMMLTSIGLSLAAIALDKMVGSTGPLLPWLFNGNPADTRVILSTIAGSMITVVGIIFSITFVALSHASTQLGPRLLDNFLQDTGNQVVLGTFVSTFLYCLLILRSMRSVAPERFVPGVSVTIGIVLAVTSIGMLIFFLHHVAFAIHAEKVVASVGRALDRSIERNFPDREEDWEFEPELRREEDLPERFEREASPIPFRSGGYLQSVDYEALFHLAREHDLILRVRYRPGDHVPPEMGMVTAWPETRIDEPVSERINRTLIVGAQPNGKQDVSYEINQLVTIAIRALSPSLNDSFLAMFCIDRLSSAFSHLANRKIAAIYRYDKDGRLRLIIRPFTFGLILDTSFHQIRQNSGGNPAVTIRLLQALTTISSFTEREEEREAILRHADLILRGSRRCIEEPLDLRDIEKHHDMVIRTLNIRSRLSSDPSVNGDRKKNAPAAVDSDRRKSTRHHP